MQAFEFAKELLLDLRRLKKDMLEKGGDSTASEKKPIYLGTYLDGVTYDDDVQPLKQIELEFRLGEGKNEKKKTYTLDIPDGVPVYGESEIDPWLEAVFEFVATCHGMSVIKAEAAESSTKTEVFMDGGVTWKTTSGRLSDIPLESAGVQMDIQMKRTLEGWTDSTTRWNDNPDDTETYTEKSFKSPRQAQVVSDLMYQILIMSGRSEEQLTDNIEIDDGDEGKTRIKMPKEYLGEALRAEQYLGL